MIAHFNIVKKIDQIWTNLNMDLDHLIAKLIIFRILVFLFMFSFVNSQVISCISVNYQLYICKLFKRKKLRLFWNLILSSLQVLKNCMWTIFSCCCCCCCWLLKLKTRSWFNILVFSFQSLKVLPLFFKKWHMTSLYDQKFKNLVFMTKEHLNQL